MLGLKLSIFRGHSMRTRIIKILCGLLLLAVVVGLFVFCVSRLVTNKKSAGIIATNFVGYDFARAVTGDSSDVTMLIKPGAEAHDFEPSPEDIIRIKNSDLFIYVGGESEKWVEELLKDNEIPEEKTLRLMDFVELKEEEVVDGMEDVEEHEADEDSDHESANHGKDAENEYDEHVWTSPANAIKIINGIKDKLSKINPENAESYTANAQKYVAVLSEIDRELRDIIAESNKKELLFGDRFPFRYFVDEYGLAYSAAFPGCSEQTEASSNTIAFLINKAKEAGIKTILKIELTSDKLAEAIADEVGGKVLVLNAAHNISQEDFDRGVTYADIMKKNIEVLKEALE